MKAIHLFAIGLFLAAVSCERHSWEDTKVLHEKHDEKGHGDKEGEKEEH
ncbi:MAG: hypothetical protein AAGI48_10400 [Verrucomicrobiota bacterium]